jgi:hypothetical protein
MTENIEKSLLELDFASLTRRTFTPSPAAWEDQVLYFLLLDRFSDGKEKDGYRDNENRPVRTGDTPMYQLESPGRVDYDTWFRAGGGWQGGTLKGLKSKLGYLRRLGITALWVSHTLAGAKVVPHKTSDPILPRIARSDGRPLHGKQQPDRCARRAHRGGDVTAPFPPGPRIGRPPP